MKVQTKSSYDLALLSKQIDSKEPILEYTLRHLFWSDCTFEDMINLAKATFDFKREEFARVKEIIITANPEMAFSTVLRVFQSVLLEWMTYIVDRLIDSYNIGPVEWTVTDDEDQYIIDYLKSNYNSYELRAVAMASCDYMSEDSSMDPYGDFRKAVENIIKQFYSNVPFDLGLIALKRVLLKVSIASYEQYVIEAYKKEEKRKNK